MFSQAARSVVKKADYDLFLQIQRNFVHQFIKEVRFFYPQTSIEWILIPKVAYSYSKCALRPQPSTERLNLVSKFRFMVKDVLKNEKITYHSYDGHLCKDGLHLNRKGNSNLLDLLEKITKSAISVIKTSVIFNNFILSTEKTRFFSLYIRFFQKKTDAVKKYNQTLKKNCVLEPQRKYCVTDCDCEDECTQVIFNIIKYIYFSEK